jgi:hypothetical protein
MMTPATVIFALPPPAPTPDTERASHQVSAGGPMRLALAGRSRPQPADEDGVRYAAMLAMQGKFRATCTARSQDGPDCR